MASTYVIYEGDGTTTDFIVPFDYLAKKFVKVQLGAITLKGGDYGDTTKDYYFVDTNKIRLKTPPSANSEFTIRRYTSATERIVSFKDASVLKANDLDVASVQTIHIAEEARDSIYDALIKDPNGNWDAKNKRIINLADPIDDTDAVNYKTYKEDALGAYQAKLEAIQARDKAKEYADKAKISETNARAAETNANIYEINARGSAEKARVSEINAKTSEDRAKVSETNAKASEDKAKASASESKASEDKAKASASEAKASADKLDVIEDTYPEFVRTLEEAKNMFINFDEAQLYILSLASVAHYNTTKDELREYDRWFTSGLNKISSLGSFASLHNLSTNMAIRDFEYH